MLQPLYLSALCYGALTINSNYENFINQIRERIVIHESDLTRKETASCKSQHGPCTVYRRQTGNTYSVVDSVVSLKLFKTEDQKLIASDAINNLLNKLSLASLPAMDEKRAVLDLNSAAMLVNFPESFSINMLPGDFAPTLNFSSSSMLGERRHNGERISIIANKYLEISYSKPVLVESLHVGGNVTIHGRIGNVHKWRSETYSPYICKIGSHVYFYPQGGYPGLTKGTIFLRDDKHVTILARKSMHTAFLKDIISMSNQPCDTPRQGHDRVFAEKRPVDVIERATFVVDKLVFLSDGDIEITHLQFKWSHDAGKKVKDQKFVVVYPGHRMDQEQISPLAPLVDLNKLERDWEFPVVTLKEPTKLDDEAPMKLMPGRLFDHVMHSLEFGVEVGDGPFIGLGEYKRTTLLKELEVLSKYIKDFPAKTRHAHWDNYFAWLIETMDFMNLQYYIAHLPNPSTDITLAKKLKLKGSYSCLQGNTRLTMTINYAADDLSSVVAEFFFSADAADSTVRGSYLVSGSIKGSILELYPVPNGWISRPKGFYPVGIIGILYDDPKLGIVYEGTIPHAGCNEFRVSQKSGQYKSKDAPKSNPMREVVANLKKQRWNFAPHTATEIQSLENASFSGPFDHEDALQNLAKMLTGLHDVVTAL